jgi:hypothetical protein
MERNALGGDARDANVVVKADDAPVVNGEPGLDGRPA